MMKSRFLIFASALIATAGWAHAQAPTTIGTFSVWNAYVSNDSDGKICFAASQPQNSKYSSTVSRRGDTFFMVTTIPAKNIRNEASTIIGFPFKANSDVTVDVDGTKFKMFFNEATAETSWAMPDQEASLIEAMKAGTRMTIASVSSRGTEVTDTYSLSGITAALNAVTKECQ
jgi:invasion protein IalB